jgi:hypothetical protein
VSARRCSARGRAAWWSRGPRGPRRTLWWSSGGVEGPPGPGHPSAGRRARFYANRVDLIFKRTPSAAVSGKNIWNTHHQFEMPWCEKNHQYYIFKLTFVI